MIIREISRVILSKLFAWFIFPPLPSKDSTFDKTGIVVVFIVLVIITVNKDIAVSTRKKVSVSAPDPNFAAINASLINPKILLPIPSITIINTDLAAFCDGDKLTSPLKPKSFNLYLFCSIYYIHTNYCILDLKVLFFGENSSIFLYLHY